MPARIDIELGPAGRSLRAPNPNQLHGWACHLLGETDEEHSAGDKPWALSPPRIHHGAIHIRLAWLDDSRRPALFGQGIQPSIRFGPAVHPVLRASGREFRWADMVAEPWSEVELEFESPTWFSRNGRRYPFPDPVLMCRRLADRWQALAEPDLLATEAVVRLLDQVQLVDLAGQTVGMLAGKAQRVGFVGRITLRVHRTDQLAGTALAGLARLAELSGVGAQTTYGAGSVRVLRHRREDGA